MNNPELIGSLNPVKKRLRVGLLVDSFIQPRWIHKIVQDIQTSSIATIVLVIKNAAQLPQKRFRIQNYWQNRSHLLFAAYNRFDDSKTHVEPDAFEEADIETLVRECPVINVEPLMTKYVDRFKEEDLKQINEYQLDVAIRLGFRILKGDVLSIARHGVWSYHHGDSNVNRGGPAGFWEVMEGEPVTGAMLQILTEDLDNGQVLSRSWSPTSDRFSVKLNRNHYYWKSSAFVMRKLRELYEQNELSFEKNSIYQPYSARLYRAPTNSEMLRLLSRVSARYFVAKTENLFFFNQWSLAYRFRSGPNDANDAFYKFKYLIPPKDRFWADPFTLSVDDKYFIFLEEFIYETGKGHISVVEIERNGKYQAPITILEKDYHLSYPFIFEYAGDYYMIPETASNNTVELYRCISFPSEWKLDTVLFEGVNATDATLLERDGLWWMFVNLGEMKYPSDWDELYIFYADSPKGEWKPHKRNPVKKDVRNSRPAGSLFEWKGQLCRPAQNSSVRYGYGISINKILRLSPDEFVEEEVSKILPEWNQAVLGTHTLSRSRDLTVIDCLMRRSRFS